MTSEKNYCSLDIETTGFDPLKEEILEVGFAFFAISNKGVKIIEEWTQVFKPAKKVSPQILGLTGITEAELETAPKFSEWHKFLQDKLGGAIILGHNIVFDIKFLEAFGLKFSGQTIDTLDLAQWILPTHHSYNLENLMHTFGIIHKEAHRALADCKATLKLLEKLLQVYTGFEPGLKAALAKLLARADFVWQDFLTFPLPPFRFKQSGWTKAASLPKAKLELEAGRYYNFGLDQDYLAYLASAPAKKKLLLVVPKAQTALDLHQRGFADAAMYLPEAAFDEKKFEAWLKQPELTAEEVKFLLKILVWRSTNWQTQSVMDLNLSFFGGQYKNQITGGKLAENKKARVVTCDMATFLYLSENKLYKDRLGLVCGLSEFENAATSNLGSKTSWGYVNYLLKSFYNPELQSGEAKFKGAVEQGLLAVDLFFGLASALLQTDPPSFAYFKIGPQTQYDERYQKIRKASAGFLEKLTQANQVLNSESLSRFIQSLGGFFAEEENRVKWIELSEKGCAFLSMPLQIDGIVKNILKPFAGVSFADSLDDELLPKFFLSRIGLKDFIIEPVRKNIAAKAGLAQGDLFSALNTALNRKHSLKFHILTHAAEPKEILGLLDKKNSFPAALLFGSGLLVKEFYEQNYQSLKSRAALLVQAQSGGSNKIFRNFSINPKSLLIATDKFVLNSLKPNSGQQSVSKLSVNILILCRLPFEQFTHPYAEAVSASLPNAFEGYALPRAFYNFHSILRFFYTPALKEIYIIDPKLAKPYAQPFKNYYQILPEAVSSE